MTTLPIATVSSSGMPDTFGRFASDLRVSVTDRCNLRCTYCMPAEGLPWMSKPQKPTDEELLRTAARFVGLGVRPGRATGRDPLLPRPRAWPVAAPARAPKRAA